MQRQVWEIPGSALTPAQIIAPVRDALLRDGYESVLDCAALACGGFDFRFNTDVLPAPNMFVNLRRFQFVTLLKGPKEAPEAIVTLLVSALRDTTYLQITDVRSVGQPVNAEPVVTPLATGDPTGLLQQGFMVLDGLEFESGATRLGEGPFSVLERLAGVLDANPELRIALVGHTDSVGSLDSNIGISRARAQAVRQRLIEAHGIDGARMEAEGMGYLAPRDSNLTEAGRDRNRRVEAIVLSTR